MSDGEHSQTARAPKHREEQGRSAEQLAGEFHGWALESESEGRRELDQRRGTWPGNPRAMKPSRAIAQPWQGREHRGWRKSAGCSAMVG